MAPRFDIADIKAALALSTLIGVTVGWDRRKTNAAGGDFWAPCPFHQERTPSFHVDDRKGFYYCFGCSASGDHVSWCQQFHGDDFQEAVARLAEIAGIAPADPARPRRQPPARPMPARAREDRQRALNRLRLAGEIWQASHRTSPLLMKYLAARGVAVKALRRTWGGPPPCLRLHQNLPHWVGGEIIHRGPAMVALISRPGQVAGVHRTWITAEGRAELGGVKLDKQWLGQTGAMLGAPVRITAHSRRMVVGEGIETTLAWWSHAQLLHLAGKGPHWSAEAALSLGALTGRALREPRPVLSPHTGRPLSSAQPDFSAWAWRAPDFVEHLVILGEGSAKDPAEAERRGWCAQRRHCWRQDGTARRCELILPPGGWGSGRDFADVAAGIGRGKAA
jgi:hypothetical protein